MYLSCNFSFCLGTSFRIGGTNVIVNHPQAEIWHAIARGNWDFKGVCTAFEYLLQLTVSLAVAGRALCGVPNPRALWLPPTLSAITNPMATKALNEFIVLLFEVAYSLGPAEKHIKSTAMASLLVHLDKFIKDFTVGHSIVRKMIKCAERIKYDGRAVSLDDLLSWGEMIRMHWKTENLCVATQDSGMTSRIAELHRDLIQSHSVILALQRENAELKARLERIEVKGDRSESKLDEILKTLRHITLGGTSIIHSPSPMSPGPIINQSCAAGEFGDRHGTSLKRSRAEDSEPVNPLSLLKTTSFYLTTLMDYTVSQLILDWIDNKMEVPENLKVCTADSTIRDKVNQVMTFINRKVITSSHIEALSVSMPENVEAVEALQFTKKRDEIARDISMRAFILLGELEKEYSKDKVMKKSSKMNVTSLYQRWCNIKDKVPGFITEEKVTVSASNSLDKYFVVSK